MKSPKRYLFSLAKLDKESKIQGIYSNCTVGWSDFEESLFYTFHGVPYWCRTPIPNFQILMLLVARPQNIFTVTLKSPSTTQFFSTILNPGTRLIFKAKNNEKLSKKNIFRSNPFCPFWGHKKILNKF